MKKEPKSKITKLPVKKKSSEMTMSEYTMWMYKQIGVQPPTAHLRKELEKNEKSS